MLLKICELYLRQFYHIIIAYMIISMLKISFVVINTAGCQLHEFIYVSLQNRYLLTQDCENLFMWFNPFQMKGYVKFQ